MASAVAAPTPAKTDEPVIFTGTDAAVSKLSAASRGYTADAFISSFVDVRGIQFAFVIHFYFIFHSQFALPQLFCELTLHADWLGHTRGSLDGKVEIF